MNWTKLNKISYVHRSKGEETHERACTIGLYVHFGFPFIFFPLYFREFPCFSILPVLTICCFVRGISFGGIYFLDNIFGSLL